MAFTANVSRWRELARSQSRAAALLYGVNLDESDVLALISIESGGNPAAVSKTGYRGLGQVGQAALTDYNKGPWGTGHPVKWEWMIDPDHAMDQLRVVAWHMARGRKIVSAWPFIADPVKNAARWADARYAWGAGNLQKCIARFKKHAGASPTFPQLAVFEPDAGKPNVRPWRHANELVNRAASDRGVPHVDNKEDGSTVGQVLAVLALAGVVVLLAMALRG